MTAYSPSLRRRRRTIWARFLRERSSPARARAAAESLALTVGAVAVLMVVVHSPSEVPWTFYSPLIVAAGLLLPQRWFLFTCLGYAVCMAYAGTIVGWSLFNLLAVLGHALTMALIFPGSRSRDRLGVPGNAADDMLVDLRERLLALGRFPELPPGWHAECAIHSAYGDKFSGDFAVTSLSADGQRLEVVLVDISGKGRRAGTRSLLFSGAVGGLLGQVEPERVLAAANSYLLRQGWAEGFASAVHLSVDLPSGDFTIGNAGHPVPFQFAAGSGRWSMLTSAGGPVLGILPIAEFPRRSGRLGRGDALVLYTDGVIEVRDHDLELGLDRLVGSAERLLVDGFAGGAQRLTEQAQAGETDDRAVVMVWRS